jgi:hypothetical protein
MEASVHREQGNSFVMKRHDLKTGVRNDAFITVDDLRRPDNRKVYITPSSIEDQYKIRSDKNG